MISYYLIFPVVGSSLVFSGFGLKSPASGFQSYSSSSLKTSPPIQHSFRRQWAAFLGVWCPQLMIRCFVEFAQHSNVLLMICGGESGLPVLFLCHLSSSSFTSFFQAYFCFTLQHFWNLGVSFNNKFNMVIFPFYFFFNSSFPGKLLLYKWCMRHLRSKEIRWEVKVPLSSQ